jgi:hypothetical protein
MTVALNNRGSEHARWLIDGRRVVLDDRDENRFIEEHGIRVYGRWFLGVDDEHGEDTKGHCKFPYGDFEKVHRCGVLAAEAGAGQRPGPAR